jgi:hypothetical protein
MLGGDVTDFGRRCPSRLLGVILGARRILAPSLANLALSVFTVFWRSRPGNPQSPRADEDNGAALWQAKALCPPVLESFSDPQTDGVPIFPLGKIEMDIEVIFLAYFESQATATGRKETR